MCSNTCEKSIFLKEIPGTRCPVSLSPTAVLQSGKEGGSAQCRALCSGVCFLHKPCGIQGATKTGKGPSRCRTKSRHTRWSQHGTEGGVKHRAPSIAPEHCLPKTGTAWVFTVRNLSAWGPGKKFSAINLVFCQEMALAGSCHPRSSRLHAQAGCGVAGFDRARWCPAGMFGKGSGRSEPLLVPPMPWQEDGGRHNGEEASTPRILVPNHPKSDEGERKGERQNENI